MTLLYRTAEWHAFAKLRLHTDSTLQHLEKLTTELGKLMREFTDITQSSFDTLELPKEKGARQRRQLSKTEKQNEVRSGSSGKKVRNLNLFTYKWHALGDYVRTIRLFGGADGFSTQVVSDFYLELLRYSHLVGRVNMLIELLNASMEQPTREMLNIRLPNVFKGSNVLTCL